MPRGSTPDEPVGFKSGADGEQRRTCPESEFVGQAAALAEQSCLADLFATANTLPRPILTAVFSQPRSGWVLLSTTVNGDRFPSLATRVHAASWFEREIEEMYGLAPDGHPAPRRLRLHGDWPKGIAPMRDQVDFNAAVPRTHRPDIIPAVRGEGVFQLPLGPVRSGPQEAGEFLFNSGGEDLVMVSPRLGYKFRAIERLAERRPADLAILLAERVAGTSTFSNTLAFTQAVERAMGMEVSAAAKRARSLMNELERLHAHLGDIGRLADATGLTVAAAQYAMLKEEVLRTCATLTSHRYLRGILAIGGLTQRLDPVGLARLRGSLPGWSKRVERLEALLEATDTFIDRLETTGLLPADYAGQHNLVGPVGRASGADRDLRRDHPYAAYSELRFDILVKSQGDALTRCRIRLFEVRQSLGLLAQLLDLGLAGSTTAGAPSMRGPGSALGWSEAAGGACLHFVAVDPTGKIERWRARPSALLNWHPYAFACSNGNNLTDYPVIEASFALSHAEFDR